MIDKGWSLFGYSPGVLYVGHIDCLAAEIAANPIAGFSDCVFLPVPQQNETPIRGIVTGDGRTWLGYYIPDEVTIEQLAAFLAWLQKNEPLGIDIWVDRFPAIGQAIVRHPHWRAIEPYSTTSVVLS